MAAKKKARKRKAADPWDQPNPRRRHTKLSTGQRKAAKKRARKAGRPYPNLVDNMAVAKKRKRKRKSA